MHSLSTTGVTHLVPTARREPPHGGAYDSYADEDLADAYEKADASLRT